jgi:hypothetical protein
VTLDERLIAYVDGELAGDDLKLFEAEVAADPRLADEVDKHRTMAARLAMAYAPVLGEKVPGRLRSAVRGRPRSAKAVPAWQWGAMAATVAVAAAAGVVGGHFAWPQEGPVVASHGVLLANGSLEAALTRDLGSQAGPMRGSLSFKAKSGRYCRTFQSTSDALAGVACRQGDAWVMQTTTAFHPAKAAPAYRTAASETPAAVLMALDGLIAGQPLEAAAEKAARDKGWR